MLPSGSVEEEVRMYEKDGEKYFIVDGHVHFWDASPENWVPGQEQYAKGWIECFHAYMGLGPAETHWPMEKFQKYDEIKPSGSLADEEKLTSSGLSPDVGVAEMLSCGG